MFASWAEKAHAATVVEQQFTTAVVLFQNVGNGTGVGNQMRWAQTFTLTASTTIREVSFAADLYDSTPDSFFGTNNLSFCKTDADYAATLTPVTCTHNVNLKPSAGSTENFVRYATSTDGVPLYYIEDATGVELGAGTYVMYQSGATNPGGGDDAAIIKKMYVNRHSSSYADGRTTQWGIGIAAPFQWGYTDERSPWLGYADQDMAFKISDATTDDLLASDSDWLIEDTITISDPTSPTGLTHATTTDNPTFTFQYYIPAAQNGPLSLCIERKRTGGVPGAAPLVPYCITPVQGSTQTFSEEIFVQLSSQYHWTVTVIRNPTPLEVGTGEILYETAPRILFTGNSIPPYVGEDTLTELWEAALNNASTTSNATTSAIVTSGNAFLDAWAEIPPISYVKDVLDAMNTGIVTADGTVASSTGLTANITVLGTEMPLNFGNTVGMTALIGSGALALLHIVMSAALWFATAWHVAWTAYRLFQRVATYD